MKKRSTGITLFLVLLSLITGHFLVAVLIGITEFLAKKYLHPFLNKISGSNLKEGVKLARAEVRTMTEEQVFGLISSIVLYGTIWFYTIQGLAINVGIWSVTMLIFYIILPAMYLLFEKDPER